VRQPLDLLAQPVLQFLEHLRSTDDGAVHPQGSTEGRNVTAARPVALRWQRTSRIR
jgi:hypothetical protein